MSRAADADRAASRTSDDSSAGPEAADRPTLRRPRTRRADPRSRPIVRRSLPWAATGAVLFVLLFYIYASSLQYAELTLVTLGWIVILQAGVVMLDRFRYGQLLAAQVYLLLASASAPGATAS